MFKTIVNKDTGRENKISTAIKKGLYANPSKFQIPDELFINKKTNRVINKKTAEKLIRSNKSTEDDIFYNKKKLLLNPFTSNFNINNKANKAKLSKVKLISTKEKQNEQGIYNLQTFNYSLPNMEIKKIYENEKAVTKLKKLIKSVYLVAVKKIKNFDKVQIVLINSKSDDENKKSFYSKYSSNIDNAITQVIEKIVETIQMYFHHQTNIFLIDTIQLNFITNNNDVGGASTTFINNKITSNIYDVISPNTVTNCLFSSYLIAENDGELENIVNMSKQLKKNSKIITKGLSDFETVQQLCNYKKRTIELLDSSFNSSKIFNPIKNNNKSTIVLQLSENHFKACVSKKEEIYHEEIEQKIETSTPIKKPFFNKKEINNKIAVWKMTTKTINNNVLCDFISFYDGETLSTFKNELEFLDFINDNFNKYNNYTFYAHKGGKLDLKILINTMTTYNKFKINTNKVINNNNSIINLQINTNGLKINFNDSYSILCCEIDELYLSFNIKDNNIKGLLEILLTFNKTMFEKLNINITDNLTSNSISKKNFFQNYYSSKYPIYNLTEEIDNEIRKGYLGGRCEVFQMGEINNNVYTYDFTSLYPRCGTYHLPYGKEQIANIEKDKILTLNDLNKMGFFSIYVKTIDFNKKPLHGMKDNLGRLIFPYFNEWTKLESVFTEEIKSGIINNLNQYKFISGYVFNSATILKDYFIDGFKGKQEAKATNNKPMEKVYKTILNSGYGFWGQKTIHEGLKVFNKDDISLILPIINNNQLIEENNIGDYTFVTYAKISKTTNRNVAIASAISSYGRIMLYNLISDIEANGGKVYYCDTDSVFTNYNIHNNSELFKKYGNGNALGSLKNECPDNTSYDALYIGGCKYYSLKHKNEKYNIDKLKGYQNKDKSLNIRNTDEITQIQKEYRNENFNIKVKNVTKHFNARYTKGKINKEGNVSPLIY